MRLYFETIQSKTLGEDIVIWVLTSALSDFSVC